MKKYTMITFVRHGERLRYKKDQKKYPGPGLSAKGKRQAELVAKFFKNFRFDAIYASDMTRAQETAHIINKFQKRKILFHRALAEFNKIVWNEHSLDKEKLKTNIRRANRTLVFFRYLLNKGKNKKILIVSHGNAIRACIAMLLRYPLRNAPAFSLGNGSITTISVAEKRIIAIPHLNLCVSKPSSFKEQVIPMEFDV